MLPCLLLWDGGVMQKSLDPFRWSSGIVCPIAWVLVHRRVLVSRGRVGYDVCMKKILPLTWIVSCATFVWSIQSAILMHSLYSGQWRGDTKVRLVVAMIQNMLLCALIIVAVIRPPKRVLDYHSQAQKVLMRESRGALFSGDDELNAPLVQQTDASDDSDSDDDERPSVGGQSTKATRPWYLLIAEIWSFVWPNEFALQIRLVGCLACLVAARILAILVPITYKIMIDELSEITLEHDRGKYSTSLGDAIGRVWPYMVALFLVGGGGGFSGILVNLRTFMWIRVQQETNRSVSLAVFKHLLDLSVEFHVNRKTGEVLRIVDRGTSAMASVLSSVVFNLSPTFFDIGIACIYFGFHFEVTLTVIITVRAYSLFLASFLEDNSKRLVMYPTDR